MHQLFFPYAKALLFSKNNSQHKIRKQHNDRYRDQRPLHKDQKQLPEIQRDLTLDNDGSHLSQVDDLHQR